MKTHKFNSIQNFKFEFRITLSYLIIGFLWILFSDELLDLIAVDHELIIKFQTYKGVFFVVVTSVFLYFFVRNHMKSLKITQTKLLESESHYKALFNNNYAVILLINPDNGEIEDANPAACKYYGFTHYELCRKSVFDFDTSETEIVKTRLQSVKNGLKSHFVAQHQLAGGELREIEVFSNPIQIGNEIMIYSSVHDITEQRIAELELRKLSKAVEQSPVAICITNTEGIIEYVNPKALQLTGFTTEEIINQKTGIFSSGEMSKREYAVLWNTIQSGKIWTGEFHNKKKNGELYWESATISPIFNFEGQITHYLAIKEDITARKLAEIALNKSEEMIRKFASHLQNVREEEKVALAREIHDDLGQTLVALKIDMGLLKNKIVKFDLPDELKEVSNRFDNIVHLIDVTIKSARRIMTGLRPELLEMHGFASAATSYIHEFEERHRIKSQFITEISGIEMNSQQSLVFFRILQESLTNIAKHSNATQMKVFFRFESGRLMLEVVDNGVGFEKNSCGRQDSYGMIGMKERIILLNGEIDIISEIGKGTSVRASIPWDLK